MWNISMNKDELRYKIVMHFGRTNDACDDGDDDGDDLPFREVISSAESARRRALFFSVRFRHRAGAELRKNSSF